MSVAAAAAEKPTNKYAGMREEIAAYKAAVQQRKRERLAAAAAAKPQQQQRQKQKPQLRKEPNAFASTFNGLVREYCTYWAYMLKTCMASLKKEFIPTICCLRAEIRT